jgi:hypothetical protein
MAQVARDAGADVDWLLDYLFTQWATLEEVAGEWDSWDRAAQADFLLDWPVVESHLAALHTHGALSPKQHARARALEAFIAKLRPTLGRLQRA